MIHLILAPTPFDRGTLQPGLHDLTLPEAESAYIRGTARPATVAEVAAAQQRLAALENTPDATPAEPAIERASIEPAAQIERASPRRRTASPLIAAT